MFVSNKIILVWWDIHGCWEDDRVLLVEYLMWAGLVMICRIVCKTYCVSEHVITLSPLSKSTDIVW